LEIESCKQFIQSILNCDLPDLSQYSYWAHIGDSYLT
jgi:hypothetical protein